MADENPQTEFQWMDLKKIISEVQVAEFVTSVDGKPWGRPMHCCVDPSEDAQVLWFFTKTTNDVCEQVQSNPNCFLSFASKEKNSFASVQVTASVSYDRAKMKELWNPIMKAWYPDGLEDPTMCLLQLEPVKAEIWDGPKSRIVQLAHIMSSIAKGKEYDGGHAGHGKVNLQ